MSEKRKVKSEKKWLLFAKAKSFIFSYLFSLISYLLIV